MGWQSWYGHGWIRGDVKPHKAKNGNLFCTFLIKLPKDNFRERDNDFFTIYWWGQLAEYILERVNSGDFVYVEGELKLFREANGRRVVRIVGKELRLVHGKKTKRYVEREKPITADVNSGNNYYRESEGSMFTDGAAGETGHRVMPWEETEKREILNGIGEDFADTNHDDADPVCFTELPNPRT